MKNSLIQKYNVTGPRYTSYPSVPYWEENDFNNQIWIEALKNHSLKAIPAKELVFIFKETKTNLL